MLKSNWGQILKERREELGLTQEDIAKIMNKTRIHVHHLESQKRPPKAQDLSIYADAVGLDISLLFDSKLPMATRMIQITLDEKAIEVGDLEEMTGIDYFRLSQAISGEINLTEPELDKVLDSLSISKERLESFRKASIHQLLDIAKGLGLEEKDVTILHNFLKDRIKKVPSS